MKNTITIIIRHDDEKPDIHLEKKVGRILNKLINIHIDTTERGIIISDIKNMIEGTILKDNL